MADIGSSMAAQGLEQGLRGASAQPAGGAMPPLASRPGAEPHRAQKPQRMHRLWESLTASLDLACRGYLCMQIVDCDPITDPECSASGKKLVVREVPPAEQ